MGSSRQGVARSHSLGFFGGGEQLVPLRLPSTLDPSRLLLQLGPALRLRLQFRPRLRLWPKLQIRLQLGPGPRWAYESR